MEKTTILPNAFNDLVKESDVPVLVDFWAEWCGPCKMIAPTIEQIARDYRGRLRVVKVNVDLKPQISAEYGIQSIPTIMLFHRGRVLMRQSGALPYEALKGQIDRAMA
ncbi:MAG: thioredoxin [Bacteroidetes bacterium]|nr:thioredoxin [Bacteroidota bacterium]